MAKYMQHLTKTIVVLCTAPNQAIAQELARVIVEKKLAACVNILPGVTSVYQWEEQTMTNSEWLLIIKTTQTNYETLEASIQRLHPYHIPEIIALPIVQGSENYLNWLINSVKN